MACQRPHPNLDSIVKAVAEISTDVMRTWIEQWPNRLCLCIENGTGHFERNTSTYIEKVHLLSKYSFGIFPDFL